MSETGRSGADTVFIACAALGREVRDIVRSHGWNVDVRVVNARHHLYPAKIGPAVEERLAETLDDYEQQVVVYGHCGSHDLDGMLAERGVVRTVGPHCYEMYGGEVFAEAVGDTPGTFILTDFLVKAWDKLAVRGLEMDKHPRLKTLFFANYERVLYLSQQEDPDTLAEARRIAEWLGFPLEHRHVGYGALETRLEAIMNGEPQPTSSMSVATPLPYPTVTDAGPAAAGSAG